MRLSDMPPEIRRNAPGLGENNDYILGELLGYSKQEIAEFTEQKVLY
jgi:crotonobetainyl-CoA:carnitine CoA-transferase CaiB-like acyl-CoA transferase